MTPQDHPPSAGEEIPPGSPQANWPRYAILSQALKLSRAAAENYGVESRPTIDWTLIEILLVALHTLREEKS